MDQDEVEKMMGTVWEQEEEYPQQRGVYEELFSLYDQVINKLTGPWTSEESIWNDMNALAAKMGENYAEFKSEGVCREHYLGIWVSVAEIQSKAIRMLSRMSNDYSFEDPTGRLSRLQSNGPTFNNRLDARAEARAEAHAKVEIEIEKLGFALASVLGEEEREVVAPILEEIKKKPTKENVSRLIRVLKELGSVAGNAGLGVLAEMGLKMALGLPPL